VAGALTPEERARFDQRSAAMLEDGLEIARVFLERRGGDPALAWMDMTESVGQLSRSATISMCATALISLATRQDLAR
jgi:hypothetical protein